MKRMKVKIVDNRTWKPRTKAPINLSDTADGEVSITEALIHGVPSCELAAKAERIRAREANIKKLEAKIKELEAKQERLQKLEKLEAKTRSLEEKTSKLEQVVDGEPRLYKFRPQI